MSLLEVEGRLYWLTVTLYAVATLTYLVALVFHKPRLASPATALTAGTLLVHAAAILARWAAVGHGPYINRYEVFSSNVWVALAMFVALQHRVRSLQVLGAALLPMAFLLMGFGALSTRQPESLAPALRGYWLVLHVGFAKLALGAIVLSFGLSVLYLAQQATAPGGLWEHTPAGRTLLARLPAPERLDELGYRYLGLGFLLLAIMIISGSIWANDAWGTYWNWDPIEVWALATWLAFGAALHLRTTYGWRGSRAAALVVLAFAFTIVAYFGVSVLAQSVHVEYLRR